MIDGSTGVPRTTVTNLTSELVTRGNPSGDHVQRNGGPDATFALDLTFFGGPAVPDA